jgi:hypothetical protein
MPEGTSAREAGGEQAQTGSARGKGPPEPSAWVESGSRRIDCPGDAARDAENGPEPPNTTPALR